MVFSLLFYSRNLNGGRLCSFLPSFLSVLRHVFLPVTHETIHEDTAYEVEVFAQAETGAKYGNREHGSIKLPGYGDYGKGSHDMEMLGQKYDMGT